MDLAPIDLLNGMTKKFVADFPTEAVAQEIKDQALDIEFHWVNETGNTASLTSGITIKATVIPRPVSHNNLVRLIVVPTIG